MERSTAGAKKNTFRCCKCHKSIHLFYSRQSLTIVSLPCVLLLSVLEYIFFVFSTISSRENTFVLPYGLKVK